MDDKNSTSKVDVEGMEVIGSLTFDYNEAQRKEQARIKEKKADFESYMEKNPKVFEELSIQLDKHRFSLSDIWILSYEIGDSKGQIERELSEKIAEKFDVAFTPSYTSRGIIGTLYSNSAKFIVKGITDKKTLLIAGKKLQAARKKFLTAKGRLIQAALSDD